MKQKLSIIIPVYNEINTIKEILRRVADTPFEKEIIVVDDGSTDGTSQFLEQYSMQNQIKLIKSDKNRGKGYALRQGFASAEGDIVIIQDADLEYYPDEYNILISKIVKGKADAVFGSRFIGSRRVFLFYHMLGNKILNLFANILFNTNLGDLMTCYKAFKKDVIRSLYLKSNDFDIEAEITGELFRRNYTVYEVPVSYDGRSYLEGKKINFLHFFKCLWRLIETRVRPLGAQDDALFKLNQSNNYNKWIVGKISPFIGNKVLEIGSGIGVISNYLLKRDRKLILVEINREYIAILDRRFGYNPNVKVIWEDIAKESVQSVLSGYNLDTVICINVLEHIDEDKKLLENMFKILEDRGRMIVLVPSHQSLYGSIDKELGHHRRYSRKYLKTLLEQCGFTVESIFHHNRLSAIIWFINYKIFKKRTLPSNLSLFVFDHIIVPIYKHFDGISNLPFGLSLIAICKKTKSNII